MRHHKQLPLPSLLLLLLLALLSGCWAARQPRQLLRCPLDFETVVEPLPPSAGDPLLLMGPGVQLRTVGTSPRDSGLRVESNRLLVNRAELLHQPGPFSGPHVMLCTDSRRPSMVSFLLYIKLAADEPASRQKPLPARIGRLHVLAAAAALAGALAIGLAVALALAVRRGSGLRSHRPDCPDYRDFRHLQRPAAGDFRAQKLVECEPSEV